MDLKRIGLYAALISSVSAAGYSIGNRVGSYRTQQQCAQQIENVKQESDRKLGQYRVKIGSNELFLNPDMSVTKSGIAGDAKVDISPEEFRRLRNQ